MFLHDVLDRWIQAWRTRQATGAVTIVRDADDVGSGSREETDARRCLADLRKRCAQLGLELHAEKTRLIAFGRYAEEQRAKRGDGTTETCALLGIAQAFDDLTADKPERPSLPINEALHQIEQQAGTAFDPTLAERFCRTMREQPPQH